MLILYLSFIESAIERNQFSQKKAIDELKGHVVLVTVDGKRLKPSDEVIHFYSKYEPQCDLTISFPSMSIICNYEFCMNIYLVGGLIAMS